MKQIIEREMKMKSNIKIKLLGTVLKEVVIQGHALTYITAVCQHLDGNKNDGYGEQRKGKEKEFREEKTNGFC